MYYILYCVVWMVLCCCRPLLEQQVSVLLLRKFIRRDGVDCIIIASKKGKAVAQMESLYRPLLLCNLKMRAILTGVVQVIVGAGDSNCAQFREVIFFPFSIFFWHAPPPPPSALSVLQLLHEQNADCLIVKQWGQHCLSPFNFKHIVMIQLCLTF